MRHMFAALFVLIAATVSSSAETPLTPEAFESYVTGKTLAYSSPAGVFGAEDYLPDRRVRWTFLDGECMEGRWYPEGSRICFVYDRIETPQCWSFFLSDGGLLARFENAASALTLYETSELSEPLYCLGPRIGA